MTLPPPPLRGSHDHSPRRRGSEGCVICQHNDPSAAQDDPVRVVRSGLALQPRVFFAIDVHSARRRDNMLAGLVLGVTGGASFLPARLGAGAVRSILMAGLYADPVGQGVSVAVGVVGHLAICAAGERLAEPGRQRNLVRLLSVLAPLVPLCTTIAASSGLTSLGAKLALSSLARTSQALITASFREVVASRLGRPVLLGAEVPPEAERAFVRHCAWTAALVFTGIALMNYLAGGLSLDVELLQDTRSLDAGDSGQAFLGAKQGFLLEMRGEVGAGVIEACGFLIQGLLTGALAHLHGATLRLEAQPQERESISQRVRNAASRRWFGGLVSGEWLAALKPGMGRIGVPDLVFGIAQQIANALHYAASWRTPARAAAPQPQAPQGEAEWQEPARASFAQAQRPDKLPHAVESASEESDYDPFDTAPLPYAVLMHVSRNEAPSLSTSMSVSLEDRTPESRFSQSH